MATRKVFGTKKEASEWSKLVDDLLVQHSKAGGPISIEAIQDRNARIQVAIQIAPGKMIGPQMKDLANEIGKKLEKILGEKDAGKSKDSLVTRQSLADELSKFEKSLLKSQSQREERVAALSQTTTVGREMRRMQEKIANERRKQFVKDSRANYAELRGVLQKQLLEVMEQRRFADSEGLAQLHSDLKAGWHALQIQDFEGYRHLSKQLEDVQSTYGVSRGLASRLDDIQGLVQFQQERSARRREKLDHYAESTANFLRVGGLYRGARSVYRGTRAVGRAAHRTYGFGMRTAGHIARGAASVRKSLAARGLRAGLKVGGNSADDQLEDDLLKRQVRALEDLAKKSGKPGESTQDSGLLDKIGTMITSFGSRFLASALPLLGQAALGVTALWLGKKADDLLGTDGASMKKYHDAFVEFGEKYIPGMSWLDNKLYELGDSNGRSYAQQGRNIPAEQAAAASARRDAVSGANLPSRSTRNRNYSNEGRNYAQGGSEYSHEGRNYGFNSLSQAAGKLFQVKPGVDLDGVDPAVQSSFLAMAAEYQQRNGGVPLSINSAFRSREQQARLHAQDPNKAAAPGSSYHERGLAIDIDRAGAAELDRLGLLSKYGFSRPVSKEPWHLVSSLAESLRYGDANAAIAPGSAAGAPSRRVVPTQASVPPAPTAASAPGGGGATARGGSPTTVSANQKGGPGSIPTFSYSDPGFFLMNAGVL